MDCRNNPCDFAIERGGQRTQGRCRCWDGLPSVSRDDRRAIRGAMQEAQGRIAALEAQLAAAKATLDEVDSILPDGHGEAGGLGVLEKAERSARCVRESAELSLKLAEAERTIAELRQKYEDTIDGAAKVALMAEKRARDAEAERDEARRVAVWAVKMCARMADSNKSLMWVWVDEEAYSVPCDGTDADIYRALREAMGESE